MRQTYNKQPNKYVILSSEKDFRMFCHDIKELAKEICYSERLEKENNYFLPMKTFQNKVVVLKGNKYIEEIISQKPSCLPSNLPSQSNFYRPNKIEQLFDNLIKSKLRSGFQCIFSEAIANYKRIKRKNKNLRSSKKVFSPKTFYQPKFHKQAKSSKRMKSLTSTANFQHMKSPLKLKQIGNNLKSKHKQTISKSNSKNKRKNSQKNNYLINRENQINKERRK